LLWVWILRYVQNAQRLRGGTSISLVIAGKIGVLCMPSSLEPYASPFVSLGRAPDVGRVTQPLSQHAFSYFVVPPASGMGDC